MTPAHPAPDDSPAPNGAAIAETAILRETVTQLIRKNNLAIFLVVVTGLAAVAIVETTHAFRNFTEHVWILTTLRIILPIAALILTGLITNRVIQRILAKVGNRPLNPVLLAPAFYFSKLASIRLLTAAGLFSSACLLFGHRTYDVILAVVPILLLLVTRVNQHGPTVFAAFVNALRSPPPRGTV